MKIVLQGSLTKRVMCKRCTSELDYEPADVKSTIYEDSGIKYHVHCPLCLEKLGEGYSFVDVPEPSAKAKADRAANAIAVTRCLDDGTWVATFPGFTTFGASEKAALLGLSRAVKEASRELFFQAVRTTNTPEPTAVRIDAQTGDNGSIYGHIIHAETDEILHTTDDSYSSFDKGYETAEQAAKHIAERCGYRVVPR